MLLRYLLVPLLFAAPAAGQTCFHVPADTPALGKCNAIPFGTTRNDPAWTNQKCQTLVLASTVGARPVRIRSLAFAPCGSGRRHFRSMRIRMDYFQGTGSTLSSSFARNVSSAAVTVLDVRSHVWHNTRDRWNTVGLQRSFLYDPAKGHLLIEITQRGADFRGLRQGFHRSDSVPMVYAANWTAAPPQTGYGPFLLGLEFRICADMADASLFGEGCKGSGGVPALSFAGSAKRGATLEILLSGAPKDAAVMLVLGLGNAPPLPALLPDAGGCLLYQTPDAVLGLKADAGGKLGLKFPVPATAPLGVRLYAQFLPGDKQANALGLTASNYGRILLGF
ncbi:MAG: hypothetical protein ACE5F1_03660 [Planctomycetota bacterium]